MKTKFADIKNKHALVALALVLALITLLAGAAYVHYSQLRPLVVPSTSLPKYPAVMGTLVAATNADITITPQSGAQKTFTVSSTTQVVTQVKSGEVGKSLADIATGAPVLVQPSNADKNAAMRVSVLSVPVVNSPGPAGPPLTLSGTLLSVSTTSITIQSAAEPSVRVTITKDTVTLSNILAGQTGKALSDATVGTYVQIFGYAGTKGPIAISIQLLIPLPQ